MSEVPWYFAFLFLKKIPDEVIAGESEVCAESSYFVFNPADYIMLILIDRRNVIPDIIQIFIKTADQHGFVRGDPYVRRIAFCIDYF